METVNKILLFVLIGTFLLSVIAAHYRYIVLENYDIFLAFNSEGELIDLDDIYNEEGELIYFDKIYDEAGGIIPLDL